MKTIFKLFFIASSVLLTNCKTNTKEVNKENIQKADTNFMGLNYHSFNGLMDIKFYDTLPNVIKQLKSEKKLKIEEYNQATISLSGYIFLKGKFAEVPTEEIYLNFDDNVFTNAIIDFGFSDTEIKYNALKEALNNKYGKGWELKKDEMCKWDFSYYVNEIEHEGGKILLKYNDVIYLKLYYNSEKQEFYRDRQEKRNAPEIIINSEKL